MIYCQWCNCLVDRKWHECKKKEIDRKESIKKATEDYLKSKKP